MPDDDIKPFQLELTLFGKKNQKTFHILEDVSLTCDLCKTPETQKSLTELSKEYVDELMREQDSLNKKFERLMRDLKSTGDGKQDNKELEKKAGKLIDKFTSVHIGKNKRLKLKFNGLKQPPFLVFEWKM